MWKSGNFYSSLLLLFWWQWISGIDFGYDKCFLKCLSTKDIQVMVLYSFSILLSHLNLLYAYLFSNYICQDAEPNDRKIGKLCDYASKNPLRIPKVSTSFSFLFFSLIMLDIFYLQGKAVVTFRWIGCNFNFLNLWISFPVMKDLHTNYTAYKKSFLSALHDDFHLSYDIYY